MGLSQRRRLKNPLPLFVPLPLKTQEVENSFSLCYLFTALSPALSFCTGYVLYANMIIKEGCKIILK